MVLAQLSILRNQMRAGRSFHPTMVLAQRTEDREEYDPMYGFHPTMVLAQRDDASAVVTAFNKFPSHYGSRSTKLYTNSEVYLKFPSHYGSRSTIY